MGIAEIFDEFLMRRLWKEVRKRHKEGLHQVSARFDELLKEELKASAPPEAVKNYSFGFSAGRAVGRRRPHPHIWWETRLGFTLDAIVGEASIPIACIGFEITPARMSTQSVAIVQVQGVVGKKEELKHVRWERLLYRTVVTHAQALGVAEVVSFPARKNHYYFSYLKEASSAIEERRSRMRLIYDKTPLKCGFVWDEKRQLFVRSFPSESKK